MNEKKQRQREEVREFLHAIRLELAAECAVKECSDGATSSVARLNEIVVRACLSMEVT